MAVVRREVWHRRLVVAYCVLIPVLIVSLFVLHGPTRIGLACALVSALCGVATLLLQRRQRRKT